MRNFIEIRILLVLKQGTFKKVYQLKKIHHQGLNYLNALYKLVIKYKFLKIGF